MVRTGSMLALVVALAAAPGHAWVESTTGAVTVSSFSHVTDDDEARFVATDGVSGVVAAGILRFTGTQVPSGNGQMLGVIKRDAGTGEELWRRVFSTIALEAPWECLNGCTVNALHVAPGGDVLLAGNLQPNAPAFSGRNMGAVRLSGVDGTLVWGWIDLTSGTSSATTDSQHDLLLGGVGDLTVSVLTVPTFTVVKLDGGSGTVDWEYAVTGDNVASPFNNRARAVAVDSTDDVIAAGSVSNVATGTDAVVVKLAGATGAEIWKTVLTSPGFEFAEHVAVADDGNVFVSDSSASMAFLSRYEGGTGAQAWREPIVGDVNALAVTAGDDVVVGGRVFNAGTDNFVVALRDGTTGAEVWRTEVTGTPTDTSEVRTLRVTPSGRILAAGQIAYVADADFVVLELDPTTGAILKTTRVDGTASGSDVALDVVTDAAGRRFAAGIFENAKGNNAQNADFGMVGFSAALGAKKLVALDMNGKAKMQLQSKDALMMVPPPGTPGDPTIDGATITLVNPITSEQASFPAPASLWTAKLAKKLGVHRYKFKDALGVSGPCKAIVLVNGRKLKVACTRGLDSFTLDEASQGTLDVRLTIGPDSYCTSVAAPIVDQPGRFVGKDAPAPTSCP